ncbi:MAG TPA: EamA family transporter [Anaerolineales bacterium]
MGENNSSSDKFTYFAFALAVIFLGVNFVAVRFSNQELPPFWGAALRFIIASVLLFGIVRLRNLALPKGAALRGALLYGLLSFALSYAFLYWGLTRVGAGMASVMFATIPLMTQLIASFIGQERLTWKGMLGATIVILGIGVVFLEQLKFDIPWVYLAAVLAGVLTSALSGIVVKHFPRSHPVSTNVVGMSVGAVLLLIFSILTQEVQSLPALPSTWLALGWLVISSIVGFVVLVWLLSRWTATATSYIGVVTPLVTVVAASLLAGETPTTTFLGGSLLVLIGVYVGALAPQRSPQVRSVRADS